MAAILRMKMMAGQPIYSTTQKFVRPYLQSGIRSRAETARCYHLVTSNRLHRDDAIIQRQAKGVRLSPLLSRTRNFSQSVTLRSSSPANETEMNPISPSFSRVSSSSTSLLHQANQSLSISTNDLMDKGGTSSSHLPQQSTFTTRILFDTIGPHLEVRTLLSLTRNLSRIISRGHHKLDAQDRSGKKETLKRRLDMLFGTTTGEVGGGVQKNSDNQSDEDVVVVADYTFGIKGHPWMKETIYSYFEGKKLPRPNNNEEQRSSSASADDDTNALLLAFQNDPTYPPNRNRQQKHHYQKHLDILMTARENSLRHPIFWTDKIMRDAGFTSIQLLGPKARSLSLSPQQQKYLEKLEGQHLSRSHGQLQIEAEKLLEMLMVRLPHPHFNKLMGALERYTRLDSMSSSSSTSQSSQGADSWYMDDNDNSSDGDDSISPLPAIPESNASHAGWKKNRIPILGNFLANCSPSHSHLVAVNLGRYFYMDLFKDSTTKNKNNVHSSEDVVQATDAAVAIQHQRKLHSARKKYSKAREDFVEKMMAVQHEFASWGGSSSGATEQEDASIGYGYKESTRLESSVSQHNNDHDEDGSVEEEEDDDVSSDLSVREFEKAQAPYSADSRKEQREELTETLVMLRGLSNVEAKKGRGRPKKDTHLKFTAIKMDSNDESPTLILDAESSEHTAAAAEAELEERIVFINNLPIDITEQEIDEIYSRCGSLDSIQLFNLRPDLDPGPISQKAMRDRRRRRRNTNTYTSSKQRPRTPVYGMLRFQTPKGYQVATSQELRLFGCVIRRHPVLSIKHEEMTNLHLEQIPSNLYSMDVEYKLAQLLHPHNVSVMLDGMNGVGMNGSGGINGDHQEYSKPASCQVKFEDFHTAYKAYQWIKEELDGDEENANEGEGADEEDYNEEIGAENSAFMGGGCQLHWFQTPQHSTECWKRELILY